nr:hypothetical protein ZC8.6 - Caenorhabditis elegans [Caenorhabditis elegans]
MNSGHPDSAQNRLETRKIAAKRRFLEKVPETLIRRAPEDPRGQFILFFFSKKMCLFNYFFSKMNNFNVKFISWQSSAISPSRRNIRMSSSGASESEVETCDENVGLLGSRGKKVKHERSNRAEQTAPLHRPLGSHADEATIEFGGRSDYHDPYTSDDELLHTGSDAYGSTVGATISLKFNEACRAIHNGHYPQRIAQGSSGSYFVKNMHDKLFIQNFV